jgi:nicotinamidase-related amidase
VTTQPGKHDDLNGAAPDKNPIALLLIDVVTDFEFPRGQELYDCAIPIAPRIAALKKRARAAGVPAIYVNDNFGRWRSNLNQLLDSCLQEGVRGRPFVEQLAPDKQDYFVLKPKHSGFYQTPLEMLLQHLGAEQIILTGLSTNSCVLFTANDAYMRDLKLIVPPDCVAACTAKEHESALEEMKTMMKAELTFSTGIKLF